LSTLKVVTGLSVSFLLSLFSEVSSKLKLTFFLKQITASLDSIYSKEYFVLFSITSFLSSSDNI